MDRELQELRRLAKANPDDTSLQEKLRLWLRRFGYQDPVEVLEELLGNKIAKAVGRPNNKTTLASFLSLTKELENLLGATHVEFPNQYLEYPRHGYHTVYDLPQRLPVPRPILYYESAGRLLEGVNYQSSAYQLITELQSDAGIYWSRRIPATATKANGREKHSIIQMMAILHNDLVTISFNEDVKGKSPSWPEMYLPNYHEPNQNLFWARQDQLAAWEEKGENCVRASKETVLDWIQKINSSSKEAK